jgi:hypothetical protein
MVHQHFVGEHECYLVQPIHIGATWTKENLIYRSSLWDKDGHPVSLSFKKFFNYDEKPDIFPAPSDLKNAKLMEKLDGSTLIFSRYKGHTVIRTRGTVDARKQENGYEIDYLLQKYSAFAKMLNESNFDTFSESFIFEWLSPTNRIVLNYGDEPDMVLTAIIDHDDYSYASQDTLDSFAKMWNLRRPRTFSYNSVEEMKSAVEVLKDPPEYTADMIFTGITFTLLLPTLLTPTPLFVKAAIVPEQAVPWLSNELTYPILVVPLTALNGLSVLPTRSGCVRSRPPSNIATDTHC